MESIRRIKPFEMVADRSRLPVEWQKWKRELERYFDASGVFSQWEKRSMLLHLAGSEIQEIFDHLPGVEDIPQVLIDPPYYDVAIKKLDEHFEPMRRKNYERHIFRQILQKSDERFADFVLRLRIQAKRCEFDKYDAREVDERIIEQIVEGCKSTELRRNILAKDLPLEDIVTLGTTLADVQDQIKHLDRDQSEAKSAGGINLGVNKIFKGGPASRWNTAGGHRNGPTHRWGSALNSTDRSCYACGYRGHLKGDPSCRAKSAKCLKCGQLGHFMNRCLKRINPASEVVPKTQRIRLVEEEPEPKEGNIFFTMGGNTFEFIVGGVKIPMIIDSGAAANLIDKATWERVREAGIEIKEYSEKSDRKLLAYATEQPMKIDGMFTAEIQAGKMRIDAKFYIIENGQHNLLGDNTAKQLKVLKVGFDIGSFEVSKNKTFPKIKGVLVEIPIDTKVQPVQQAYRRAPIPLEERIFEKLQYLLDMDIIEKVEGPSPWVSPLVPVLKESGDIRLCVDMRQANRGVLREYHPFPLIEELLGRVNGAVKFSKVDVKDAYHQLELSEESRVITTFITKYGLFRYKRLMFGISCAPEIFQKVMDTVVAGLEGVVVYLDDIVVSGRSQEEHDRRLEALLARLEEYGVLLNKEKCLFNVDSLEFLGHQLTVNGIKPTDNRVAAIKKFREPVNVAELRSFLGLITYVGRFIPHLATKTDPLRVLLRTGKKFEWTEKEQTAFEEIKSAVSDINYLGFFNPLDVSILVTDASPSGLGAVLLQENVKSERRIIAYASKSLSDLERKYFQTEREALGLVWGVEHFKLYLLGTKFKLVTDCKPLQFLFGHRSKPCARMERWVLRLQSFNYEVVYEPGITNLADALSRLSPTEPREFDREAEAYIQMLMKMPAPVAITPEEIITESKKDDQIKAVIEAFNRSTWADLAKAFKPYAAELYQSEGVLLRGDRIVIPETLRQRVLELGHEGHPGIVVMKRRLRQKVWWPGMDLEVEHFVKRCKECLLVSSLGPPEPLVRTQMPDKPWVHIAVDFMGPLPSGHNLLVMVDYFSRFVEVAIMKEITAKLTVLALHETFCRYGIPESLKSDNGPQFVSETLKEFCKEYGIELRKTTPYWPQANGEVERANRALKKRLQISQETVGADWKWDLRMYMLMYNSTPHSTTGVAPSLLMFGRVLRDKLPAVPQSGMKLIEDIQDRDREKKEKEAEYANSRKRAKPNSLKEGDVVLAKRILKDNKLTSNFSPEELTILKRNGTDIKLHSKETGKIFHRNVSHLKRLEINPNNKLSVSEIPTSEEKSSAPERPRRESKQPGYLSDYTYL